MELTVFRVGVFLSLIAPRFSNYGFSLLAPLTSPSIFDKKNCFIFLKFHFSELLKKANKVISSFYVSQCATLHFCHSCSEQKQDHNFFFLVEMLHLLLLLQKQAVHFIHRSSSVCLSVCFVCSSSVVLVSVDAAYKDPMDGVGRRPKKNVFGFKKERKKEKKKKRKKERKSERNTDRMVEKLKE
jgi:hypothetical protein